MVRHHDPVGPGVDRRSGIVGVQHTFDDEGARPACANPGQISPGRTGIEVATEPAEKVAERRLGTDNPAQIAKCQWAAVDPDIPCPAGSGERLSEQPQVGTPASGTGQT